MKISDVLAKSAAGMGVTQPDKPIEFNMDFCVYLLKSRGADDAYANSLCKQIQGMYNKGDIKV
jgi:hypothetical protein